MTDEQLGRHLAPDLTPDEQLRLVRALPRAKRDMYVHMIRVAHALNQGRSVKGVLVDPPRRRKSA